MCVPDRCVFLEFFLKRFVPWFNEPIGQSVPDGCVQTLDPIQEVDNQDSYSQKLGFPGNPRNPWFAHQTHYMGCIKCARPSAST